MWRRVLPTVAAVAVVALTVSLGRWQLDRAQFKMDQAEQRQQAALQAPLTNAELAALVQSPSFDTASPPARRVKLQGRFDAQWAVYIDNRLHQGIAGMHVLMPFYAEGITRPILVIRGWVPRDPQDRNRLPRFITPAEQIIEADIVARPETSLELGGFHPGPQDRLWPNVDSARFAAWSKLNVVPWMLREGRVMPAGEIDKLGNTPEALGQLVQQWPEPATGADKHRGYAFQWFSLAALAGGLWLYFVVWRGRAKRS
jgi:surfeit locus 1 family protein